MTRARRSDPADWLVPRPDRTAFRVLRRKLDEAGLWESAFGVLAAMLVQDAARFDELRRHSRRVRRPALRAALIREAERARRAARRVAADFLLVRRRDVARGRLDAQGRDLDLVAIFDPSSPLVPVGRAAPVLRLPVVARRGRS